ncbi:UNVERIFIED_ORG: hypothetical protein ABIB63_000960 [Xanthomonas axonopodis]
MIQAPLDRRFDRPRPQQATACIEAEQVFDRAADLEQFRRKPEQLHIARIPRHQVERLVDHHHALRQVFQAAAQAGIGLLRGGDHAVLGGAQFFGVLLQQGFQFVPAALAQRRQPPPLLHEQPQQGQGQPRAGGGNRRGAAGSGAGAGVVQQMQAPAAFGHFQGLPQHLRAERRVAHVGQHPTVPGLLDQPAPQRQQLLVGVLAGALQFAAIAVAERGQHAVAPFRLAGQKHHIVRVRRQHDVRGLQPLTLQCSQGDLDHHHALHLAGAVDNGLRQEIAWLAGGHANAVEAAAAGGQRLLVIRTEGVVHAHVAAWCPPVAGGQCHAVMVDQGQRGRLRDIVGAFELAVERIHLCRRQRAGHGRAQLRVQRQNLRQRAVAVHALLQRLRVEPQLAAHGGAFIVQRALFDEVPGRDHGHDHPAQHDGQGEQQATALRCVHGRKYGGLPADRAATSVDGQERLRSPQTDAAGARCRMRRV